MKALNKFIEYENLKKQIQDALDISITYDIDVSTERYAFDGNDLNFGNYEDGEFEYGEEATLWGSFEDCELYLVWSCTGERYLMVFDIQNKVGEDET